MNKAITEGLDLMPPAFVDGLDVWSSEDGRPGTVTYDTNPAGVLFSADADFGDCLELEKVEGPQRLRHMGETPFLPGCYLQVSARVKLINVANAQVRIATFPGDASGNEVIPVPANGPVVSLDDLNRVYTVQAIIGSGARTGVDMVWGTEPVFAHVGLDILGDNGAVIRIESIVVEDVTSVFQRKLLDVVDVIDYGAVGDGITNDAAAFEAADAAAAGRVVVVPEGTYFLNQNVTMLSPVRFSGTVVMPENRRLVLRRNFDLPSYAEAFGDETTGLKKGLQALFNFSDHDTFDLGGRQVDLTEPIDVHAAVDNVNVMTARRVIRNGVLAAEDTAAWDPSVVTGTATYNSSDNLKLTNVTNIAAIEVGSLVEGFGVGREVYVRAKNDATQEITLSDPLYRAATTQTYTFTRFRYMLDFSGFTRITDFFIDGIHFDGARRAAGVMLPVNGTRWFIRNCYFLQTGLRGVTSIGDACQGITVEQCEFRASDADELIPDRRSIAFNVNQNDAKIRDNRCINHRHMCVVSGTGNLITGNHVWQVDSQDQGEKTPGIVLTDRRSKTTITGNYLDNQFIELTSEHRPDADATSADAFGRLGIVGNIFTAVNVPVWFTFIRVTPTGTGHRLNGLNVIGNTFQLFGGARIDRVEDIDTSTGTIDHTLTEDCIWSGNAYSDVTNTAASPVLLSVSRSSAASTWTADATARLPFGGFAMGVDSVTAHGAVRTASGSTLFTAPWVETQQGASKGQVTLNWSTAVRGTVQLLVRSDRPS